MKTRKSFFMTSSIGMHTNCTFPSPPLPSPLFPSPLFPSPLFPSPLLSSPPSPPPPPSPPSLYSPPLSSPPLSSSLSSSPSSSLPSPPSPPLSSPPSPPLSFHYRSYLARLQNKDTGLFCLQVMVGVIILYDHIHPMGAFAKKSSIDVSSQLAILLKR